MHIEEFREFCLAKPGVTEGFPFGEDTLVLKVMDKVFALTGLSEEFAINLKCDPERAVMLREENPAIQPGYHMNKKHWNTVILDGELSERQVRELADHSYSLVKASLPKALRPRKPAS